MPVDYLRNIEVEQECMEEKYVEAVFATKFQRFREIWMQSGILV